MLLTPCRHDIQVLVASPPTPEHHLRKAFLWLSTYIPCAVCLMATTVSLAYTIAQGTLNISISTLHPPQCSSLTAAVSTPNPGAPPPQHFNARKACQWTLSNTEGLLAESSSALTMVEAHLTAIRGESWEGIVACAVLCQLKHICITPVL